MIGYLEEVELLSIEIQGLGSDLEGILEVLRSKTSFCGLCSPFI
jgi:hypothetical protein